MEIVAYSVSDVNNTLDREISDGTTIEGTIKNSPFSILNPTFLLKSKYNDGFFPFNYLYVPTFGRYYFITNVEIINTSMVSVSCKVDVLKTYANTIKSSSGLVTKSTDFNKLVNRDYESEETRTIEKVEIPISFGDGINVLLANKGE